MEEAAPRNGDPFVSLSVRSVVNQSAFANNCGIPIGAVVNCVSPEEAPLPVVRSAPSRCRNCGAFMNAWCTVGVASKAGKWRCCLCAYINDGPPNLDTSFTQLRHDAVLYVQDPPPRQLSPAVMLHSDPAADLATAHGAAAVPQQNGVTSSPSPSPAPTAPAGTRLALLFDTTLDEASMRNAQSAASGLIKELSPSTQLSIITFGASVSVFDLGEESAASALVVPGHREPDQAQLKTVMEGISRPSAPVEECSTSVLSIIDSLRSHASSLPRSERKRCMGSAVHVALCILGRQKVSRGSGGEEENDEEYELPSEWNDDRVVVMSGGTPTYGPGTIPVDMVDTHTATSEDAAIWKAGMEYFRRLGRYAAAKGIAVDIFAPSTAGFNIPLCLELAHTSGGEMMVHNKFGTTFQQALKTAISRKFGVDTTMDIYASKDLRVSQVLGSVGPLRSRWRSRYSANACSISTMEAGRGVGVCLEVLRDLLDDKVFLQVVMEWTNPQGQKCTRIITNSLKVVSSLKDFVQSIDPEVTGTLIAKKLILEGHKAGTLFDKQKMDELRISCGAQLSHMAKRFGSLQSTRGGWFGFGGRQMYSWPHHLVPLARILYQLQRSPLLIQPLLSPPARTLLTKLFLRSSFLCAEQLVNPCLYLYSPASQSFQEVPPVTLAVSSDTVLVVDGGCTLFLWVGSLALSLSPAHPDHSTPDSEDLASSDQHAKPINNATKTTSNNTDYSTQESVSDVTQDKSRSEASNTQSLPLNSHVPDALLQEFARFGGKLSTGRFPTPDTVVVQEGDVNLWPLVLRLVPVHLDNEEEQRLQFPQKKEIVTLDKVQAAGRETCGLSLIGWCREQGVDL